jgi:hypothetical protein
MLASSMLVAVLLSQPRPETVDISAWKAQAKALTDGKGHFLVYDAKRPYDTMFYGDEKKLVQLRMYGGGMSGTESWSTALWDPRIPRVDGNTAEISMSDSGKRYQGQCGKKVTELQEVNADKLAKLLSSATFAPASWDRMPERLLRDDKGTYYFVDRLRTEDRLDRRDFRLFVGPRGKMKQLPLKDIVDDSEGMVFATKGGELRLIFANVGAPDGMPRENDFKWVDRTKKEHLTDVPLDLPINARLVYMDLGVYAGARLGTPCDDWM